MTWVIIDSKTGLQHGKRSYTCQRLAGRLADKLDTRYGAYRYSVVESKGD